MIPGVSRLMVDLLISEGAIMGVLRGARNTKRDRRDEPTIGRHRRRFPRLATRRDRVVAEPRHRLLIDALGTDPDQAVSG